MKIIINGTTYTKVKTNLSFAPETDVFGNSLPINEFRADIVTTDDIAMSQWAELRDDLNTLWAKYWIVYAERIDRQTVRIQAQSALRLLERKQMPAVMVAAYHLSTALSDIFNGIPGGYVLDSGVLDEAMYGFFPEQNARDRLLWVLLACSAYAASYHADTITILPLSQHAALIPIEKTFWKPSITYRDYVTAINVTQYSFTYTSTQPETTDEWVTADGVNYYIVTKQTARLVNQDVPAGVPDNEITIDGVTIVDQYAASRILSHLALYYFKRAEVELEVIDNAEYWPGQRVTVYTDENTLATGYISSCSFGYGNQAKAKMKLCAVDVANGAPLKIVYKYGDLKLGEQKYYLPVGYYYDIENPYIDVTIGGNRFVFRPLGARTVGTMPSEGVEALVNYLVALNSYTVVDSGDEIGFRQDVLAITSVSGVAMDSEETDVAVIE
ncbi:MAG: hypothetical protein IIX68_00675 [Clostridia bacterium]|nr:hypothetical protein [Clostridia bacterium]